MIGRAFVLDLLEFVLLHRPAAFQTHSSFKVLLQSKVRCWQRLQHTRTAPMHATVSLVPHALHLLSMRLARMIVVHGQSC